MRAARFMLQRIQEEVAKGESFAFETTLANRSYARWIREWQAADYHVALWFLALPSVEAALGSQDGLNGALVSDLPAAHVGDGAIPAAAAITEPA